jgi:hypothetical protein
VPNWTTRFWLPLVLARGSFRFCVESSSPLCASLKRTARSSWLAAQLWKTLARKRLFSTAVCAQTLVSTCSAWLCVRPLPSPSFNAGPLLDCPSLLVSFSKSAVASCAVYRHDGAGVVALLGPIKCSPPLADIQPPPFGGDPRLHAWDASSTLDTSPEHFTSTALFQGSPSASAGTRKRLPASLRTWDLKSLADAVATGVHATIARLRTHPRLAVPVLSPEPELAIPVAIHGTDVAGANARVVLALICRFNASRNVYEPRQADSTAVAFIAARMRMPVDQQWLATGGAELVHPDGPSFVLHQTGVASAAVVMEGAHPARPVEASKAWGDMDDESAAATAASSSAWVAKRSTPSAGFAGILSAAKESAATVGPRPPRRVSDPSSLPGMVEAWSPKGYGFVRVEGFSREVLPAAVSDLDRACDSRIDASLKDGAISAYCHNSIASEDPRVGRDLTLGLPAGTKVLCHVERNLRDGGAPLMVTRLASLDGALLPWATVTAPSGKGRKRVKPASSTKATKPQSGENKPRRNKGGGIDRDGWVMA